MECSLQETGIEYQEYQAHCVYAAAADKADQCCDFCCKIHEAPFTCVAVQIQGRLWRALILPRRMQVHEIMEYARTGNLRCDNTPQYCALPRSPPL